jgi:hypothetical protein
MSNRLEELATRRRRLLLRSERLRAELAADQQVMLAALSGVDRAISVAKKAAKPVFLVGAGLLLLKLLRRGRVRTAGSGFLIKAMFWVSAAQRALPYVSLARNLWRSRSSRYAHARSYADAGAETEHLL